MGKFADQNGGNIMGTSWENQGKFHEIHDEWV
jgi:hypothetical protein